ncbi:unnamed protein product [Linum tenue]|uniref:MPN domain-containing protein n=1 Tax=Linum tenue TaxID=586396 RepID=A0AAV0P822_9ROSI|nr:unnamed protein product [Linum tenue]
MKIDLNKIARKVEVDNRIPLRYYYRIADNLLRQATVYRDERNVVDLYIMLLRFSSLVSETIPFHRDYHSYLLKDKAGYKKRLLSVLEELESLKPEFNRRVEELNRGYSNVRIRELDGTEENSYDSQSSSPQWPSVNRRSSSGRDVAQPTSMVPQSSWKNNDAQALYSSPSPLEKQLHKLSIGRPAPNRETLSRHSLLGPNGLNAEWRPPTAAIKVQYPSHAELASTEDTSLNLAGEYGSVEVKNNDSGAVMDSILSLDDGRWIHPAEEPGNTLVHEAREDPFQFVGIRQPSPPPVLAQVQHEYAQIAPSKVADPRPGPAPSQEGMSGPNSYQDVHIVACEYDARFLKIGPGKYREEFRNVWCSGWSSGKGKAANESVWIFVSAAAAAAPYILVLCAVEKQGVPHQHAYHPKARVNFRFGICQTLNEEEIFEVQDKLSLFPLGWIHTHPTQTCFMSSVDLHTHYSYQIMLPEAIAIVMAPTDDSSPHGIFHLSDPAGVSVIRNCQQRGFHPHEEPLNGNPIYEHCSHVYLNSKMKFEVMDLR